jgi:hypothetical protein
VLSGLKDSAGTASADAITQFKVRQLLLDALTQLRQLVGQCRRFCSRCCEVVGAASLVYSGRLIVGC